MSQIDIFQTVSLLENKFLKRINHFFCFKSCNIEKKKVGLKDSHPENQSSNDSVHWENIKIQCNKHLRLLILNIKNILISKLFNHLHSESFISVNYLLLSLKTLKRFQ